MGYKIKELRKKKGMSQEELAKQSGVSRTIISFLENGTKEQTTLKTLNKIAMALGVHLKDIFLD